MSLLIRARRFTATTRIRRLKNVGLLTAWYVFVVQALYCIVSFSCILLFFSPVQPSSTPTQATIQLQEHEAQNIIISPKTSPQQQHMIPPVTGSPSISSFQIYLVSQPMTVNTFPITVNRNKHLKHLLLHSSRIVKNCKTPRVRQNPFLLPHFLFLPFSPAVYVSSVFIVCPSHRSFRRKKRRRSCPCPLWTIMDYKITQCDSSSCHLLK